MDGGLILPGLRIAGGGRRELDPSDPINRGLVGFWPMDEAPTTRALDLSRRQQIATPTGAAPTLALSARGQSYDFAATPALSAPNAVPRLGQYSLVARIRPNFASTGSGGQSVLGRMLEATIGTRQLLRWESPSAGWYFDDTGAGAGWFYQAGASAVPFAAGEWALLGFSYGGAANTGQFWWNGRPMSTTAGAASNSAGDLAGHPFNIGRLWNGSMRAVRFYGRELRVREWERLADNDWAGTTSPAEQLFHAVRGAGAAPGSYTLALDVGTFTLTGQALALRASRRLPLAAGAFALSGQAVALRASRRLGLAAGGFALSGQALALRASRRVSLAAGSFALSGQAIALRASRRLGVAAGAFSLSGQPVGLRASRRLPLSAGSYALTGQDLTLRKGYGLTLDVGTFALSRQPVALLASRRLSLVAGALALTGQPVALLAGRRMTLSPGALALTGQPVQLRADRRLRLDAGAFVLTGQPLTLAWSGEVPIIVPPSRTYRVPSAPRRHALAAEPRTYRLLAAPRRYIVPPEA